MAQCPCCGNVVKNQNFIIDLNTNKLTYNGEQIRIPKQIAVLFHMLSEKFPSALRTADLFFGLYGYTKESGYGSIRTLVSNARKIGYKLNFTIETVNGVGYLLKLNDPKGVVGIDAGFQYMAV